MANVIFYLMLLSAALPLYGAPSNLSQDDEKGIRALFEAHYSAWNQHDAKKMADLYTGDANLRFSNSKEAKNRKEIEAIFIDQHSNQMKNARIENTITSIQLIKPDLAFVDGDSTIEGIGTPENSKPSRLFHHVVFLVVKRDGQWKILIGRPF